MAVLIDRPAWPAHDTLFCHLVSDSSPEELHDLAERVGLPPRAFDRDHYDVPARLYDSCVAAGAIPTDSRTLVVALRRSGLRRPKAVVQAENQALRAQLLGQWPLPQAPGVAKDLLDRWGALGRYSRDLRRLEERLTALRSLQCDDLLVTLAVWYHDAVFEGRRGADEDESAQLAEHQLAGLVSDDQRAEVVRLVRTTIMHNPEPGDWRAEHVCDVDLAVLAAPPDRYDEYRRQVRRDYAEVPLDRYREGRLAVLNHLASLDPLFHTARAREHWTPAARANIARDRAMLN